MGPEDEVLLGAGAGADDAIGFDCGIGLADELGAGAGAGEELPELEYTFRELMVQYASLKAEGLFWTYSLQVAALEEQVLSWLQTWPAQSPVNGY